MLAIARFFLDLCLLRRNPQDLPASAVLLAVALLIGLLGGMLLSLAAGAPIFVGVAQTALDFLLMLGLLHLALKALDKSARFLQTATALVGADTLIGLVALLPLGLAGPSLEESPQLLLAGLLFLGLVVWSVVVTGHILRHALDIRLAQGVAIGVAFDVLSFVIVGALVEGAV